MILYFLLPMVMFLLENIPNFRQKAFAKTFKSAKFWVEFIGLEVFSAVMLMFLFMDFLAWTSLQGLKIVVVLISTLFFFGFKYVFSELRKNESWKTALVGCVLLALFLEGTVFNFRFYQSYDYQEIEVTEQGKLSSAFVKVEDTKNVYEVKDDGTPYFEIRNLDEKIDNIYVDVTAKNSKGVVVNAYVEPYLTDESNQNYLRLPVQTVMSKVESTKYLFVLTNGETEQFKLKFSSDYAETYQINGIYLNVPQAMNFSWIRFLCVGLLVFLFWLLRPSGSFFARPFSNSVRQKAITVIVVVLQITLLFGITAMNPAFSGNPSRHTAQYQQLAESFLDGQLYLEEEPPEFLAEMENPYDQAERAEQAALHGESYYWDAAYFEGRYYVYFGVLPVLLLYVPYRWITGTALPNFMAIQFFLCFFVIGSFLLIGKIIKKYFSERRIPYLAYLILTLIFVNASGGVFIAKRPDFYSIPIISALAFTVFGLYFWIKAEQDGTVHPIFAGLGSLCMALVAGCRPQLLLVSALIFVIYWKSVFRDRSLFSKKGLKSTVALILPYVLVAAGIMWYNFARFGSPLDFGANYNLTTNDMTGRGYRVERIGLAVFTYFFQLPNFTATFPFLQSTTISTNYLGRTITEPTFGGIFAVIPLLWVLVLLPSRWNDLKKRGLLAFCLLPILLSFVIGIFDAQGAGLLQRYVSDFSFLFCLGAVFFVCFLFETLDSERTVHLNSFLRFALFASGAYCFCIIFAKYSVEIFYRNPYLFNTVSELVQFW